jgi:lipid-binding SYLF domain-containing protein
LEAEIYAYSKSKGLFIGISLKGAAIKIDGDSNRKFYDDPDITAHRIFTDPALETRPGAEKLRQILTEYLAPGTKI